MWTINRLTVSGKTSRSEPNLSKRSQIKSKEFLCQFLRLCVNSHKINVRVK